MAYSGSHIALLSANVTHQSKSEGQLDFEGRTERPQLLMGKAVCTHKMGGIVDATIAENLPSWPQPLRLPCLRPCPPGTCVCFFLQICSCSSAPSSKTVALEWYHLPWNPLTSMSSDSIAK